MYRGREGQWAFVLHRLSGLAILFYLLIHVISISLFVFGEDPYMAVHRLYGFWPFSVGLIFVTAGVVYRAHGGGRPERRANSGAGGPAQGGVGADSGVGGEAGTQLAQFQPATLERWARSRARQEADDGKEARRTGWAQRTPEAIAAEREGRLPGAGIPRGVQPLHGGAGEQEGSARAVETPGGGVAAGEAARHGIPAALGLV